VRDALAQRYLSLNEFGAAETELKRSISLKPSASAYREWGRVLAAMGREQEALAAFDHSLQLEPQMWQTLRLRALLHLSREQYPAATRDFQRALELNSQEPSLYLEAGRAFLAGRMEEEAVRALNAYVRLRPRDAEGFAVLGSAHMEFGRMDAAEDALQKALTLDARNTLAHRALARVYTKRAHRRGNLGQALSHLKTAAELEPLDGEVHWQIGQTLLQLGKPQEAVAPLREAVRLAPQDYRIYYTLSTAYARIGETQRASEMLVKEKELREYHNEVLRLRTVLQADPNDADARLQLARWHRRVGDGLKAAQEYQLLIQLKSDDTTKQVASRELTEVTRQRESTRQ
jgi:tetratricopeptide (TPR) repeat protein